MIFIVKPFGNFPLNDDWAYAFSVEKLYKEGKVQISDWASPTLILQVLWGFLFAKVFGYNFFVLRLSVIVLNLIGIYCFFLLIDKIIEDENTAFLTTCVLIFNPIYFNLTYTFMTDVPFVAITCISLLFYYKFFIEEKGLFLLLGSVFSACSMLVRQFGIVVPIGVLIYLYIEDRLNKKNVLSTISIPMLTLLGYLYWFNLIHHLNLSNKTYVINATLQHIKDFDLFVSNLFYRFIRNLFYWGLCASPLSIAFLPDIGIFKHNEKKLMVGKTQLLSILCVLLVLVYFIGSKGPFPYFKPDFANVLNSKGLGIITIPNAEKYKGGLFFESKFFWYLLSLLSAISILFIFTFIITNKRYYRDLLILIIPASCLFFITTIGKNYFDRYTISIYPAVLLLAIIPARKLKLSRFWVITLILFMCMISLLGTYDYFRWNEAKWMLGRSVTKYGLELEDVFNGYDWCAFYLYEKNMNKLRQKENKKFISIWDWMNMCTFKAVITYSDKKDGSKKKILSKLGYNTPFLKEKEFLYLWETE